MSLALVPEPGDLTPDEAQVLTAAPLMASDPDLTVADAMRRRLGKAA